MRRTRPALALPLAVGAALLLGACSGGGEPEAQAPAPAPSTTAAPPTATPTGGASPDGGSTGPTTSASTTPSASSSSSPGAGGGAAQDLSGLALEDRHPNGALLQVTSLAVERTGVVVGVSVVNGHTDPIRLNSRGLFLEDDQGNGYNFREPQQNGDLEIEPGAELVGELVFLGVLDPGATELTLKTNVFEADQSIDTTSRADYDTAPSMLVPGIPVG